MADRYKKGRLNFENEEFIKIIERMMENHHSFNIKCYNKAMKQSN